MILGAGAEAPPTMSPRTTFPASPAPKTESRCTAGREPEALEEKWSWTKSPLGQTFTCLRSLLCEWPGRSYRVDTGRGLRAAEIYPLPGLEART